MTSGRSTSKVGGKSMTVLTVTLTRPTTEHVSIRTAPVQSSAHHGGRSGRAVPRRARKAASGARNRARTRRSRPRARTDTGQRRARRNDESQSSARRRSGRAAAQRSRGRDRRQLRPTLRFGGAGAHVSDPVRLAAVPRAVVAARERPVRALQPRRRLRSAIARGKLRAAERAARGRFWARPHRVVADDHVLAGASKEGRSERVAIARGARGSMYGDRRLRRLD